MRPKDLHHLVNEGESERLEFKAMVRSPAEVARSLAAFLNRGGGQLIIGVGDRGKLLGVENGRALTERLSRELAALITPPALWSIECITAEGHDFVVAEVAEGMDKPYVTQGAIFVRRGSRDVPANREEITSLIEQRAEAGGRWERQIVSGAEVGDLDPRLIRDTAAMAIEANRWNGDAEDLDSFLHAHGLFESGRITNAALLLFGKSPTRFLPQARVRVVGMPQGKTGGEFEFERMFDSCLLRLAEDLPSALASRIGGVSSRFTDASWQRDERILYPPQAIREGILNALIHRDYRMSGSILISIFSDSLQISSPGRLPKGLEPADLKREHPSIPVNPDVAHICYLHKLIEKVGRGTQRIVEACRQQKLKDPRWTTSPLETALTFFAPVGAGRSSSMGQPNSRQTKILEILSGSGQLSAPDITKMLEEDVTSRTVRSDIKRLLEQQWIRKSGRARSVVYNITPAGREHLS